MLLIALIPIIICLWVALKKRLSFLGSVQLACLGFALYVLIVLGSLYLSTGKDVVTVYLEMMKQTLQQNEALTMSMYAAIQSVNGAAVNAQISMNDAINQVVFPYFSQIFVYSIPAFFAAFIPIGGLLSFLIVRAIVKKAGGKVTHVPAFADFKLPEKFGRWSLIILIVCWIGQMAGWRNFDFVLTISFAFFGSIYFVLGMAFLEWAMKKQIKSAAGRGAIIALLAIIFFSFYIFTFIGIFEQIAKIRQRSKINKVGL
ncbi:MAG: DUF2232 domain-containing protein [Eubacteriales bacterium]